MNISRTLTQQIITISALVYPLTISPPSSGAEKRKSDKENTSSNLYSETTTIILLERKQRKEEEERNHGQVSPIDISTTEETQPSTPPCNWSTTQQIDDWARDHNLQPKKDKSEYRLRMTFQLKQGPHNGKLIAQIRVTPISPDEAKHERKIYLLSPDEDIDPLTDLLYKKLDVDKLIEVIGRTKCTTNPKPVT